MNCPKCGSNNDKVLESRANKDGSAIRRRRECLSCGYRFTSYDHIDRKPVIVIMKDGRHQTFDFCKVERGIRSCTEKLPIAPEALEKTLMVIEDNVISIAQDNRNMISSSQIGEETLKALYPLSPVAYVRFAAVYRVFNTLDQFITEIESLAPGKK
ncbi:MAG: transcriptional repressor NrdR [Spirochaetales bacterium]|nr:transcriptional repressor NrdR [Candidatus Physcosoma equi]